MLLEADIKAENIEYDIVDMGSAGGTSLQGEVTTTYDTLENLFGEPSFSTGDPYEKTHSVWVFS